LIYLPLVFLLLFYQKKEKMTIDALLIFLFPPALPIRLTHLFVHIMIKMIFMANLGVFLIGVIVCFTSLVLSPADDNEKSERMKYCKVIAMLGLIVLVAAMAI